MDAEDLIRYASQVGFVLLFVAVAVRTVRAPLAVNALALLFFGIATTLVLLEWVDARWFDEPDPEWFLDMRAVLLLAFPLVMLLLADSFMAVPQRYIHAANVGAVLSIVVVLVTTDDNAGAFLIIPLAYFLLTQGYASVRFVRASGGTVGLARKRLRAVSVGAAMLVLVVAIAIPAGAFPDYEGLWSGLSGLAGLVAGVAFFAGFAPPRLLKAAWQGEEIRRALQTGPAGTWVTSTSREELAEAVQEEVRSVVGSNSAVLWLWDEHSQSLVTPGMPEEERWPGAVEAAMRAYRTQQPLLTNVPVEPGDPRRGVRVVVPITRGERRWGAISAAGHSATLFVEDDVWLLSLLADHVGLALEHNELLAQLSEVRAKEDADQLKEDFLSSVAHDLQTPLTTVLGEVQLMERRANRNPELPADTSRLRRVIADAQRMRAMVRDLLDFSRADHATLVAERLPVDIAAMAQLVAALPGSEGRVDVAATEPAMVIGDEARLLQVFDNLLENALKYSEPGQRVLIEVTEIDDEVRVKVTDHGIGIAPGDLPFLFDRFWRSRQVDDRRYHGIGLGLFICSRIAEEHGGSIAVESTLGVGSTFTLVLPCAPVTRAQQAAGVAEETDWLPSTS